MLIYVSEAESTKNTNKKLPKKMKRITLKQKRSWIRIVEAFIAVMIVMSVVLVVISRQPQFEPTTEEELVKTQRHILDQVKETPDLRTEVLARGDLSNVNAIVAKLIPEGYSYETRVCDLETICSLGLPVEGDIFVEEVVISADLTTYKPTLLKLFFWEGEYPEDYAPVCGDGVCGSGETEENCPEDCAVVCTPNCEGKVCGDDGCGGSCGTCSDNQMCKEGQCVAAYSELTATITVTSKYLQGGAQYYNYDLVIQESNGVGVNINRGRECFDSKGCDPWVSFSPVRRVPAAGQYTRSSYWWTFESSEGYWLEYEGIDDNDNSVSVISNKLTHPNW